MNTAELVAKVSTDHGLKSAEARAIVDTVLNSIVDSVKAGNKVALAGFGNFEGKEKPARTGRNPSTGAPIQIAASKGITFKPAKAVKDKLNG